MAERIMKLGIVLIRIPFSQVCRVFRQYEQPHSSIRLNPFRSKIRQNGVSSASLIYQTLVAISRDISSRIKEWSSIISNNCETDSTRQETGTSTHPVARARARITSCLER